MSRLQQLSSASLVVRVGVISSIVQWVAAVAGFLLIESARISVQWDFPTGRPTNEMPKWLGLLLFPVFSTMLTSVYSRSIDAPGIWRTLRIGIFTILALAQLAILIVNL